MRLSHAVLLSLAILAQSTAALVLAPAHPQSRPLDRLRGGADGCAVDRLRGGVTSDAPPYLAWLRVLRRLLFPGNPLRTRAPYTPPPPPAPPATEQAGKVNKGAGRGGARTGAVHSVHSKAEFDKVVASARGKQLVVVDFAASWCGPCQQIAPKYEAMAAALPHVRFLKVDVDECKDLSQQYGVQSMPTFKMIRGGKEVDEMKGADESALREKIEALAGKPDRWASAGSGRQL